VNAEQKAKGKLSATDKPIGMKSLIELNKRAEIDKNIAIISVDLQFKSNLRLGIAHNSTLEAKGLADIDPNLYLGLPPNYNSEYEVHQLRFERYFKLP
jgi:hypothetical protein